jgi:hypothetical protein
MAMYEAQELSKNIFYFKNAISEPARLIDFIEKQDGEEDGNTKIISKWAPWRASNSPTDIYGEEKLISSNFKEKELTPNAKELYIINSIRSNMHYICTQYKIYNDLEGDVKLDPEFGIKKYYVGESLGKHADQYDGNFKLRFSIVAYLNDDYTGGELAFANQNVMIKPEAGSIVIFPSSEPYLHESKELKSGVKYMCPGFWMH